MEPNIWIVEEGRRAGGQVLQWEEVERFVSRSQAMRYAAAHVLELTYDGEFSIASASEEVRVVPAMTTYSMQDDDTFQAELGRLVAAQESDREWTMDESRRNGVRPGRDFPGTLAGGRGSLGMLIPKGL